MGGYVAALFGDRRRGLGRAGRWCWRSNRADARRCRGGASESLLAGRSLAASLSRTSVVVAALATAIAMMASVGIMVGSFRETVALWLDVQFRADLYVRPPCRSAAGQYPPMAAAVPALLAAIARAWPRWTIFTRLELHYRGERATLGAGNLEIVRRYGRLRFLAGRGSRRHPALAPRPRPRHRQRAIRQQHGVRAGDRLTLPHRRPRRSHLTVAGIYYDYSSSQGYVILDRSTLLKYLPGQPRHQRRGIPGAGRRRRRGCSAKSSCAPRDAASPSRPTANCAAPSMEIFDRTFAITWALEAVAILVAMLGAANSLLALVLDRRRELGLLRYLGASAAQIRGMILTEAGVAGLLAAVLGLALGLALSLLLIFVVNKQSFGWTIQFHPPAACWPARWRWCGGHGAGRLLSGAHGRADGPGGNNSRRIRPRVRVLFVKILLCKVTPKSSPR